MRNPIAVQVERFDVQELRPDVVQIRADFVRYLSGVPRKSKESKHGLMGPVGKFVSKIKGGMKDPGQLKGYILNVDRAVRSSFRTTKKLSPGGMEALERGIDRTCELLKKTPPTVHDVLIDQLDYSLYFDLRKAETVAKEARRQAWIGFVRDKYGSEAKLSEAWGEEVAAFDDLYLPRKAEGSKTKKASARQHDIAAFWESQGAAAVVTEEEEE